MSPLFYVGIGMSSIFAKLDSVVRRYQEIEEAMALPEVAADFLGVQELAKERASLEELVQIAQKQQRLVREQQDLEALLGEGSDPELTSLAKEELASVEQKLTELGQALRIALLPKDPT